MIKEAIEQENIKYRKRLFDPIVTLWTFIYQVLDPDKSCRKAVSHVLAFLADTGEEMPSVNTGAYCKARKRLSLNLIIRLFRKTGQALHEKPTSAFLWCNRRVFMADGSTFTMYDTEENQQEYPQAKNQHEHRGFPLARIVGIFCLATGALIDAEIGSFWVSESQLFWRICSRLNPGDVALADRLYGTYNNIAILLGRGVDSVFRVHHLRKIDFSKGEKLGPYDHLVVWKKSSRRTLSQDLYDQLPETMLVREIRYWVHVKGFRTKVVTIVTTLVDHKIYTYELLGELYGFRWQVEIDLRHVKTTMKMEHLHSKSPDMVRKEFYVHLLAYNLIRSVLWESGIEHDVPPLELSYKGAIQKLLSFVPMLGVLSDCRASIYSVMLEIISKDIVPQRPYRIEPRKVRTKKKSFPRLSIWALAGLFLELRRLEILVWLRRPARPSQAR
jgi:hypothetical protein